MKESESTLANTSIAVVGMAGRFPGARNLTEFWRNLRDGVESITTLRDEALLSAGVTADELENPDYVRAAAILDDIDRFDAAFFGLSPRDAAIMDPQHRQFLECSWEALENAGWAPEQFEGRVGVYAGSGMNSYLINNLLRNSELVASAGLFLLKQTGNDKDVLATRVSYQLDLTGPSLAVQTACSTSLVAIHLACQALLAHECDMALAGGVTIEIPHGLGYLYREGEILSRDGHCRSFDAAASGTIFGSGLGVVVLRRLDDAIRDGDFIHAVIRGTAINNDGARKVSYLAPSVAGQADAIIEALTVADVSADSISYVETHGTGTSVGDPIEVAALTRAFRLTTERSGFCAIGALKTNIGHLDAAAGVAGFIKTVLALEHRQLPPSLNFSKPNPLIDFEHSPFYVNNRLRTWETDGQSRRAGVTSLGIGGTNAHAVLEEAPPPSTSGPSRPWQLLTLSAKTPSALDAMAQNLADHLADNPTNLADAAFTTHTGRKAFRFRRAVVCETPTDAAGALRRSDPKRVISSAARETERPVIFLCSGQGSQYVAMGRGLYESEAEFRATIDFCAEYLRQFIGTDLRTILFPSDADTAAAAESLNQTRFTQPALFVVEYAMAKLWSAWGIEPAAMIGHSVGEFAAACLAGVFSLEAALEVIAERGRLIQSMPGGAMTAVPLPESRVASMLNGKLSLASVNSDEQCVISGPDHAIGDLEKSLADKGIRYHRLMVSHAFHSSMMDPIVRQFAEFVRRFEPAPPRIPFVSSATGDWITDAEATSPDYWSRQLRHTVRFSEGIAKALKAPGAILLEIGPGHTLSALCEQSPAFAASHEVVSSLRSRSDDSSDAEFVVHALGQLWAAGKKIDWKGFHSHERRRRLPLPTYPFERERYWIEPSRKEESVAAGSSGPTKGARALGLFAQSWQRADLKKQRAANIGPWLIFEDSQGLGARIAQLVRRRGEQCIAVQPGRSFARLSSDRFEIAPDSPADYQRLLSEIPAQGRFPRTIVHLWSVCDPVRDRDSLDDPSAAETMSFYSLLFLGQALGAIDLEETVEIAIVSNGLHQVADEPILHPGRALLAGPCGVIPKELSNVRCRNIDVELLASGPAARDLNLQDASEQVVAELLSGTIDTPAAYRKNRRWVQTFTGFRPKLDQTVPALRDRGVYLITGGLGGIGLALAETIATSVRARLVLVGRTDFPPRESWDEWLHSHGDQHGIANQIRKIRSFEVAGAEIMVARGDVCDRLAMQRIADQVHARFGSINGIIHAAGVLDDAPLLQRDRDSAARVLAPKVRGTLVLDSIFQREPLDFFILMSSVSSHLAPAGQVDYAAANAFLDAFARYRAQQGAHFISIQWPRWTDVGMVADRSDVSQDSVHPLLGRAKHEGNLRATYSTTLSLDRNWIVGEHRLNHETGLFPATGYLEMVRAAATDLAGSAALSVSDFSVSRPLRLKPNSTQPLRLSMHKEGEGYRFSAQTRSDRSERWIECASGEVAASSTPPKVSHLDLVQLRKRCSQRTLELDRDIRNEAQERYIQFGPRWRSLKAMWLGRDEALSQLKLPEEFAAEVDTYRLHPALLDMATGSALLLIKGNETARHLYVPISYGSVRISAALPATCYAYVQAKSGASIESPIAVFDVSIMDPDGNVVVEVNDFSVRQVRDPSMLENTDPRDKLEFSEATLPVAVGMADAISSDEGRRAFELVLANRKIPSVVVFPSDFSAYVERGKPRLAVAEPKRAAAIVPDDANEEVEATLTRWWKELLGVEAVTSHDNFFDLGGQSLTGVRLLAKMKKKYGVDLKLATLFSAPTIEKLCALVGSRTTPAVFQSLIEIQPKGSKPPLFLIHEIEGSVIVFRDLVKHLDSDQPVWGVEYSLNESSSPFLRMEDLAAYYLREVRQLQPTGPYYLLGYSFGGLLAFEMAQQLHVAGQRVELLGMLDTFLMNGVRASAQNRTLLQQLKRKADSLGKHVGRMLFGPDRRAYLKDNVAERLDALIGRGRQFMYGVLRARGHSIPKFLHRAKDVNWFAALRYEALPYPGRITLFRASVPLNFIDMPADRELGWGPVAKAGVEVHEIPGTHREIMREPGVAIVGREVTSCLAAAHARTKQDLGVALPNQAPAREAQPQHTPTATEQLI
jgi:acyl transferase domain-containing protein